MFEEEGDARRSWNFICMQALIPMEQKEKTLGLPPIPGAQILAPMEGEWAHSALARKEGLEVGGECQLTSF